MANFNETLQKFSESNKTAEIQIKGQDRPLEVNMVDKKFTAADKEAQNAQERGEKERTALLQDIAVGISNMTKSLVEGLKKLTDPALMGLGLLAGLLLAPLVVLASFFKQLAVEVKFFAGLIGKLGGIFKPIKNLFTFLTGLTLGWVDELKNLKIFEKIKSLFTFLKGIGLSFVDTLADLKIFDRLKTLFSFLKGLGLSFVDTLGDLKIFERLKTLFAFFKGIGLTFVDTLADLKIFERLKTLFAFFKGLGLSFIDTLADLKIFDRLKTLFSFLKGIGLGFVDTLADIKVFDKIQTLFAYIRGLGTKLEFVKDLANITFDKIKLVYNFFKNVAKSLTFFDNIDLTPATKAIQAFRKAFDVVKGGIVGIGGILDTIGVIVKSGVEKVAKAFATSISVIMKGFDIAKSVFSTIGGLLRGLGSIITVGIGVVVKAFVIGAAGVSKTFDIIKSVFGTIGALLRGIGSIISFGVGAVSKAFALSVTIVTGAFTVIRGVFSTVGSLLRGIASIVQFGVSTVVTAFGAGVKLIMGAFSVIKTGFTIVGGLAKGVGAVIGLVTSGISKLVGGIFKIVGFVFSMVQSIGKVASTSASFMKLFGPIFNFAAGIGTTLGKIFLPISIIMGIFDFVSGFIDGYSVEGTPAEKITNGIKEGLVSLFDGIFGMPLRMIGAGIAIVANYLGFDFGVTIEATINAFVENVKEFIRKGFDLIKGLITGDISFNDILNKVTKLLKGLVKDVQNWFTGLFTLPSFDTIIEAGKGLFDIVETKMNSFLAIFPTTDQLVGFLPNFEGILNKVIEVKNKILAKISTFLSLIPSVDDIMGFFPSFKSITDKVITVKNLILAKITTLLALIPTVNGIMGFFPSFSGITDKVLTLKTNITTKISELLLLIPSVNDIMGFFPSFSDITTKITNLKELINTEIAEFVKKIPTLEDITGFLPNIDEIITDLKQFGTDAFNKIKELFSFSTIKEKVNEAVKDLFDLGKTVASIAGAMIAGIQGIFGFNSETGIFTVDLTAAKEAIGNVGAFLSKLASSLFDGVKGLFGFGGDGEGVDDSEIEKLKKKYSPFKLLEDFAKSIKGFFEDIFDMSKIKGFFSDIPLIGSFFSSGGEQSNAGEQQLMTPISTEGMLRGIFGEVSILDYLGSIFKDIISNVVTYLDTFLGDVLGDLYDSQKELRDEAIKESVELQKSIGRAVSGQEKFLTKAGRQEAIDERFEELAKINARILELTPTTTGANERTLMLEENALASGARQEGVTIVDQSTVTNNDNAPSIQAIAPTTTENQDSGVVGFLKSLF